MTHQKLYEEHIAAQISILYGIQNMSYGGTADPSLEIPVQSIDSLLFIQKNGAQGEPLKMLYVNEWCIQLHLMLLGL